jgi:predicted dithiol-disulfide oxidoreductase (DUF899 family)
MNTPPIVSPQDWAAARRQLLVEEKEMTRARDALAAKRRRMPWLAVEKEYEFDGPDGKASLVDLFDGRRQLIVMAAAGARLGCVARARKEGVTPSPLSCASSKARVVHAREAPTLASPCTTAARRGRPHCRRPRGGVRRARELRRNRHRPGR